MDSVLKKQKNVNHQIVVRQFFLQADKSSRNYKGKKANFVVFSFESAHPMTTKLNNMFYFPDRFINAGANIHSFQFKTEPDSLKYFCITGTINLSL